jgi:PAS domain S-box-containing protein
MTAEASARDRGAARAERERQFDILVATVTDYAIYMLDPQGNVTTWNVGAERIKGYSAGEIVGENYARFFTEEDRRAGRPAAALAAAERDGRYEAEGWRVRRDGSRLWVNAVIYPVRDEARRLTGFVKVIRDITERLRQQDALERARAAALQLQKMEAVGQLTGGVAHDFNNILTTVLGLADVLGRRGDLPASAKRQLSLILRAAERGAALTQRLLAFSRRQALEPHPLDVNRLVGGMSDLLRRTLGETVKIEAILAAGLWRTFVDANQLESALLNLGINARDAMPDGGKLTIETGNSYLDDEYAATNAEVTAGQYVLVAVTDTGEGMVPEVAGRAFEPFYTTKAEGKGTGLGLSQVYGFVKQSGGHIKIYSEPGTGTCVKIYLPRHFEGAPVEERPQRPDLAVLGQGEKILVVDDDEDVRQYVCAALISLGYRVLEARDGPAALQLINDQPDIALLFTDVGLPGMNGRRLAEAAHARLPHLKILYATGYARNAVVHNGLVDPGVNLLPKPFTVEGLGRKLRQVLEVQPS